MTEEKAQDTLRVGIEELLEKEGKSWSDAVKSMKVPHFTPKRLEGLSDEYVALVNREGGLSLFEQDIFASDVPDFIKWLQDNFLPKGKKDGGQKDQIFLCNNYIKMRDDGESAMVFGNGTHLDGYAIIPIEEYEELGGKPFEREDSKTPFEDT